MWDLWVEIIFIVGGKAWKKGNGNKKIEHAIATMARL